MDARISPEPTKQRPTSALRVAPDPPSRRGAEQIGQVVILLRDAGLIRVIDDVQERLESLLETGPRIVVVDMSEVGRLSSTTIAALLWVKRCCAARGVDVRLRELSRGDVGTLERIGLLGAVTRETMSGRTGIRPDLASVPWR